MTAATAGSGSARSAGFTSVARINKSLAEFVFFLYGLLKVVGVLVGIAAIFVADVYIGGEVLVSIFSGAEDGKGEVAGWSTSFATSAVLTVLWGVVFARKRIALLLALPALVLTLADFAVDERYPTMRLYGRQVMIETGVVPPQAVLVWWLLEVIFGVITLFGEAIISLMFAWVFAEIARMGASDKGKPSLDRRGIYDPDIDLALDDK